MSNHPSRAELSDFLLGKMRPSDCDTVATHVAGCSPCQETLHGLERQGGALVEGLRRSPPARAVDPNMSEALSKAAASPPRDAEHSTSAASATGSPAPSREKFVATILSAGVIDDWPAIEASPAVEAALDAAALARALVHAGHLTKFQAQLLYQGRTRGFAYGDYVVLDRLGAGGMGQVYKARHRHMDRIVALKVMAPSAMKSPDSVKRFQREVKAAARLIHTNIVTAFDASHHDGVHYLVMECVEGSDLSTLVKKGGPLSVDHAVSCIVQAARGLEHAHAKGIIHRDIKPSNLLLDKEGVIKILDMGLARIDGALGSPDAGDGLTTTGNIMGTVDYMSPEQAMDTKHADARADIYSLGCTLYFLLSGKKLHEGDTVMKKLMAHREAPTPSLTALPGDLPWSLDQVFQKMVAKRPEERYQTMFEARRALEEALPSAGESLGGTAQLNQAPSNSALKALLEIHRSASAKIDSAGEAVSADTFGSRIEAPTQRRRRQLVRPPTGEAPHVSAGGASNRRRLLAVASGAAFLLVLAGVIIIVRDPQGRKLAEFPAPDGSTVEMRTITASPEKPGAVSRPSAAAGIAGERSGMKDSAAAGSTSASSQPFHLEFDGSFSRIEVPDWKYAAQTPLTAEAWIACSRLAKDETVLGDPEAAGWYIWHQAWPDGKGRLGFRIHDGTDYVDVSEPAIGPVNRLVHVAGVYDGEAELRLYVDGKEQSRARMRGPYRPSSVPLVIGANADSSGSVSGHFAGAIGEVRISDVVRYDRDFTPARRFEPDGAYAAPLPSRRRLRRGGP